MEQVTGNNEVVLSQEQRALITQQVIGDFEKMLFEVSKDVPQNNCPVTHHFGPDVYIREIFIPEGTTIIGAKHKHPHLNVLVQGTIRVMTDNGGVVELTAPMTLMSGAGKKAAYAITDTIWQNVYSTPIKDATELESVLFEQSEAYYKDEEYRNSLKLESNIKSEDHKDFLEAISEYGLTEEQVKQVSENTSDLIDFPFGSYKVQVGKSDIAGTGLIASGNIKAGDVVCVSRINGKRTPAGRYINHAKEPNCIMVKMADDNLYVVAIKDITGNMGGILGEEITVDYRQVLKEQGLEKANKG